MRRSCRYAAAFFSCKLQLMVPCVQKLALCGALVRRDSITHRYPYDWRARTPVIIRATEQWFADVKVWPGRHDCGGVELVNAGCGGLSVCRDPRCRRHSGGWSHTPSRDRAIKDGVVHFKATTLGSAHSGALRCR